MGSGYILAKGRKIHIEKPLLMGILNVTPDSFSDGGKYMSSESALERSFQMLDDGADIIDIGAESSRPFAMPVSVEDEKERIGNIVRQLSQKGAIVSIDTYKPAVADFALSQGAAIVNDITGLRDPDMIDVVARHRAGIVIMHMQGTPRTMQVAPKYNDVVDDILEYLEKQARTAQENGIDKRSIVLDPGIGFGKSADDNFTILREIESFLSPGYPVLIGASRKSFLKEIGQESIESRITGSLAAASIAVFLGAAIIRTHDIPDTRLAIDTAWTIRKGLQ